MRTFYISMELRCYDVSMKYIKGSKSYRSKKPVMLHSFGCLLNKKPINIEFNIKDHMFITTNYHI